MGLLFAILLIILLIAFLIWVRDTPEKIGKRGEQYVSNLLEALPDGYYIYNDVILSYPQGTIQIDHIVASQYGVFVIETKNYRGKIYGSDSLDRWKQVIVTEVTYRKKWWKTYTYVTKNELYNPARQSVGHSNFVKKLLKEYSYLPIVPIVVFVGEADISCINTKHTVIYDTQLLDAILQYKTICLSNEGLNDVLNILDRQNIRVLVEDKDHVKNVRKTQQRYIDRVSAGICPRCGGYLVKRNGKYGLFYGCSNYPNCKYIVKS